MPGIPRCARRHGAESMATPKTRQTTANVDTFLDTVDDPQRRQDARHIVELLEKLTKAKARMWGAGMVGCGTYHRTYANGRSEEWMLVAMAPRKDRITLYVAPGFEGHDELMTALGTYRAGKGCIHIKRLADIHVPTLKRLVTASIAHLRALYP
jgi:hypothetical protein